ncbi:hypothetical protein KKC83_01815 [Patescibacteria group bacterium]|nr:hypothetical protein [Candidatus Falkowbacteria bacterium]MBU3905577.1 hypothetical protein [Patescibacteria group bacterium]MCG2698775.1 hypothetical protein [Candidatus Parcubacteria bacterium]MBU4015690.1 hypothetical protein [Patescibacteria group bacterium]MBU4026262.1 hypothetical protein [Patescibacteria group bacterium]
MIPKCVKPFLWSYNTNKLDLKKNKKRIIANVLNFGSQKATAWLFAKYSKQEIKNAIVNTLPGDWSKKSLNYWSIIFNVKPAKNKRIK